MTNLLVIIADDMRLDHLPFMVNVRKLIQDEGRTFTNARCNIALCQPNRVGFLTGQATRHHDEVAVGFYASFKGHDNTIAAWMTDAGHRCALFGKYLNYFDHRGGLPAPAGWASWRQITNTRSSVDFDVIQDQEQRTIVGTYQTEYLAKEGATFIRESAGRPWMCVLTPQQPHAPFAPHPQDQHAYSDARCRIVDVPDVSRKPEPIRSLRPLAPIEQSRIQQSYRGRLRELAAVDRMVGSVVEAVIDSGQIRDTVIVFTSDNGVHQGEQRRRGDATKGGCYDVGLRVPLVIRGGAYPPGPDIDVPVYPMQDITATALDLAAAEAGLPDQLGVPLPQIVARPADFSQRVLLHETAREVLLDADGITTGPDHQLGYWKLFRHPAARFGGEPSIYEMYDLAADPDELTNVADLPEVRTQQAALEQQLETLLG